MVKVFKSDTGRKYLLKSYDRLLQLWGAKFKEKDVETRYGTTHVVLCGNENNPPLILFHGVGDNSALMWIYNARQLSESFYLIAIDTIGGPGKSIPNNNYGKEFSQVAWIDDILDSLGLDSVCAAGVSNGAYLAQLYTSRRPDRVQKAVCMAGAVAIKKATKLSMFKTFRVFFPEALFPSERNARKLLSKLCGKNRDVFLKNNDLMQHWLYLLKYSNPMAMAFHKIEPLNPEEIRILSQKALFIIGASDPIATLDSIEIFKDSNINYLVIEGSGHGINHEFSDMINAEIEKFLLDKKVLN